MAPVCFVSFKSKAVTHDFLLEKEDFLLETEVEGQRG